MTSSYKPAEMLNAIEGGTARAVVVRAMVGNTDKLAVEALRHVYDIVPQGTTYADIERILVEALWWHTACGIGHTSPEDIRVEEKPDNG